MTCIFTGCNILNQENGKTYRVDVFLINGAAYTNSNEGRICKDIQHDIVVDSFNLTDTNDRHDETFGKWIINNPVYSKSFIDHIEKQLKYVSPYVGAQLYDFIESIC